MNTKTFPTLMVLLLAVALPVRAADERPAAATNPPAEAREMAAVEQFLDLSDAELDQVQQVIARIRAMTPEQRAALRAEIARYRQLPEPQRLQLRQGWGWMPREIQEGWREMMQTATPERRAEIQARLQTLPPDEKTAYRRKLVEEFLQSKAGKK